LTARPAHQSGNRVVVTGAAGFIGSRLVERLAEGGREVIAVDCLLGLPYPAAEKEIRLEALAALSGVEIARLDLTEPAFTDLVTGAGAVINLAALTGLNQSTSGADYRRGNVTTAEAVVGACLASGVGRLVHASTSSVYGAVADGDEDSPLEPISEYGRTKLEGEWIVLEAAETEGLPATVLRYFSVFGPGQRPDMGYRRLIDAVLGEREFEVFGDGTQTRSATFVDDVVEATVLALEAPTGAVTGEVFNVAGGESVSLNEAIGVVEEVTGCRASLVHLPARPGDQSRTAGDWSKAREVLGFSPSVSFPEGIERQIAWQREIRSGADRQGQVR
jgi:UDP-glucuronate 4-epimerase